MDDTQPAITVAIDADLCAGSGMCRQIAPTVFDLPDDADTAVVLAPTLTDPELIRLAREAEQACPTLAVLLARA